MAAVFSGLTDEKGRLTSRAQERRISQILDDTIDVKAVEGSKTPIKSALVLGQGPVQFQSDEPERVGVVFQNGNPDQAFVVFDAHVYPRNYVDLDEGKVKTDLDIPLEGVDFVRKVLTQDPNALMKFLQDPSRDAKIYDSLTHLLRDAPNPLSEDQKVSASVALTTLIHYKIHRRGDSGYTPQLASKFLRLYSLTREGTEAFQRDLTYLPHSHLLEPGCQIRSGERLCDLFRVSGHTFEDHMNQAHAFYWGLSGHQVQRAAFVPEVSKQLMQALAHSVSRQYTKLADSSMPDKDKYFEKVGIARRAVDGARKATDQYFVKDLTKNS